MSSQIFFDELSKNKKVSEIFLNFLRWLVFGCKASNTALSTETDDVIKKKACMDAAQQTPNSWQVSAVFPRETEEVKL